ncbi:MAG: hypothetical protein IJS13_10135 [Paludibacteraceae bacterium]|nr:hypothetical protein [Paludibacteraceae bacterium]
MKKLFTLAVAALASFSLWAAYAPTADEVIILNTVYEANAADAGYSNHAAIAWGGTASTNSKKAGDPNNNGEATSSNVPCFSVKGNGKGKNITVTIEGCSQIIVYHEKHSSRYVELKDGSATGTLIGTGAANTYFTTVDLDANTAYSIFLHGTTGSDDQDFNVYAVKLIKGETCNDPQAHLAFTKSTAYVGEQFSYNFGSQSGGDLTTTYTLNGAPAVENTDYTFTSGNITVLNAGQFVMHMTVGAGGGYCAADLSDTILINEATPVTEVTVDGPATAYVGEAVTFTATAENASDYAWTVNGVDANTNAAEFIFTPAAAGEYSIVCSARNKFNAADEWIASEAKVLTASNVSGEIIKVELTSGTAATVTGILGGTADANLSSNKKMDKGKYFGFTLAKGAFAEGDTVVINLSANGQNYPCLFADKNKETLLYLATETSDALEYRIVLPAAANGLTSLYFVRDADDATYKWNPTFTSVSVIRPKAVDHADVTLVGATIDGEALPSSFVTHLINEGTFTILTSYVNAPVVTFVKHSDTYYEGETEPVSTNDSIKVTATEVEGEWQAQATIGENTYTINLAKATSFVVTYMDGETVLGTENVAVNGNPAEYAQYQSKNLATFLGWYSNADLADEHAVADMAAEVIDEATTYYAKFENKYAESINIEKAVMENGKGYGIIAQLGTLGYASNITGSLDSLGVKDDGLRNYAYLGLKVKQNGALLNFRLAAGNTVTIKFGEIKKTPNVSINGGEYAEMVITDKVYTHTAGEADELISIKMMDGNAVVFQQIMIGEELQAPELFAINCAEAENGTVAAPFKLGIPGEEVELTLTPAEGYIVMSCTVNGTEIHQSAPGAAITFEMPAEDVTIETVFSLPTALENAEAAVKVEKVIRDGQVLILRDGKIFNALGSEIR